MKNFTKKIHFHLFWYNREFCSYIPKGNLISIFGKKILQSVNEPSLNAVYFLMENQLSFNISQKNICGRISFRNFPKLLLILKLRKNHVLIGKFKKQKNMFIRDVTIPTQMQKKYLIANFGNHLWENTDGNQLIVIFVFENLWRKLVNFSKTFTESCVFYGL